MVQLNVSKPQTNNYYIFFFNSKLVLHSHGMGFEMCISVRCIMGSVEFLSLTDSRD